MNKMRFAILLLLFGLLLGSLSATASSYVPRFEEDAVLLKDLGLFKGTDKGFELDRPPTRLEALVMLIRLLGQEQDALNETAGMPFNDVPDWGTSYVAYAYKNGLTMGMNDKEFGSTHQASEQMFVTFVLRSLGYEDENDGSKDFTYEKAVEKAKDTGLLSEDYLIVQTGEFMRDGCVAISKQALKTTMKNKTDYLIDELIQKKAVDANKAKKVISDAERFFQQAEVAYKKRQTTLAEELYGKAIELEPQQAKYYGSLASMYQWLTTTNQPEKEKIEVNAKLFQTANQAFSLAPNNADYAKTLMKYYFDNENPKEATILAEKYLTLAKQSSEAYEWLARGYNEYALVLLKAGEHLEGRSYLEKAIALLDIKQNSNNKTIALYVGKSYLAQANYEKAEELLLKSSTSMYDIKWHSDWMLYLINEKTNRAEDNKKFVGKMWMGMVTSNAKYLEMKSIIDNMILT